MEMNLEQHFFLNPDGSGKVNVSLGVVADEAPGSPEARQAGLDGMIREEISKSRGVDTWGEIGASSDGQGASFHGTAYFKDVSELRLHLTGFHLALLDFNHRIDEKGAFVLETRETPTDSPAAKLSETELRKNLPAEREKITMIREFLGALFSGLTCRASVTLPGTIAAAKNVEKTAPNAVTLEVKGRDLLDLIDRVVKDDALMLKMMKEGGAESMQNAVGAGPLHVVVKKPLKPLFDYESEAEAARAAFAELAAQHDAAPAASGPPLSKARVGGVKLVYEGDNERGLAPMGQNTPGISMSILGDLPGPAVSVKEGRVDRAVTDAGENLAPDDDWKRRIHFPKLSNDRTTALLDLELPMPPKGTAGFKEIAGILTVVIAEGTHEVDLGFRKLEAGAEGSQIGAAIEGISDGGDETYVELKFAVGKDAIQGLKLVDAKGGMIELRERGYSSSGDQCQLSYAVKGPMPPKGKFVATLWKGMKEVDLSWAVTNIDLFGRPR